MVVQLFDEGENVKKEVESEGNDVVLKLQTKKMSLKFQFQVKLVKGDEELVSPNKFKFSLF